MMSLTEAVGPRQWREASVKTVKVAQALAEQGDVTCHTGRMYDPLPTGREVLALQSNERAHSYVREARDVVTRLHKVLQEVSDEIRNMTRCKQLLEKSLDHRRKDLHLNRQTASGRQLRPRREMDYDGADSLIESEFLQLKELIIQLEVQLHTVKEQLHRVHSTRLRLLANIQERSRVLPLACVHGFESGRRIDTTRARHHTRAASAPPISHLLRTGDAPSRPGSSQPLARITSVPRSSKSRERSVTLSGLEVGSTRPLTGEVVDNFESALMDVRASRRVRKQAYSVMGNVESLQQAAHRSVSDGITQKVAETVTLKQHLQLSEAETRQSMNRARRWLGQQEKIQGYTQGPVSYNDLTAREKLDRPLIRAYQSHPGTNLPEARELVRNSRILDDSMRQTTRSLGLLRLAKDKLEADRIDKQKAADVDSSLIRLRRRRADHRWVQTNPTPKPAAATTP